MMDCHFISMVIFSYEFFHSTIHGFTISLLFRKLHGFYYETIISSKTNPHNGSKQEKESYGKIKNNKAMLKILPFIRIVYHKQVAVR